MERVHKGESAGDSGMCFSIVSNNDYVLWNVGKVY